jgi:hypothetical protein
MLLEFIATIALGLGTAGLLLIFNRLLGRRLPGWVVPAGAGLAMILFLIYLEYSWAPRTAEQLPEGVVVTSTSSQSMWYRPWTYVRPLSLRMIAVDTRRNRTHPDQPDRVMTTMVLFERWMPTREIPVVFDCRQQRRADLHSGVEISEGGELSGADWYRLDADDRSLQAACAALTRGASVAPWDA